MHYYLYKITNLINNKIYIGVHKTDCLDDGYMGSGKKLMRAIKKYGISNFRKDILEYFDSEESMYDKEISIVDQVFLLREDVYNMKLGGPANFYYVNKAGLNHKVNQHLIHGSRIKTDSEYREQFSIKMKEVQARPEVKEKQRRFALEAGINRGRFWISNDVEQKSIMIDEESFGSMIGWYKGLKYRKQRHVRVAE